jgi:hypothetical protein
VQIVAGRLDGRFGLADARLCPAQRRRSEAEYLPSLIEDFPGRESFLQQRVRSLELLPGEIDLSPLLFEVRLCGDDGFLGRKHLRLGLR